MYVVELKNGRWICSESRKEIEKVCGKLDDNKSLENIKNLWYQPFNYQTGSMSDFFLDIENSVFIDEQKPMRKWVDDLPLSKCIQGGVEYLGKKEPKWYVEILKTVV